MRAHPARHRSPRTVHPLQRLDASRSHGDRCRPDPHQAVGHPSGKGGAGGRRRAFSDRCCPRHSKERRPRAGRSERDMPFFQRVPPPGLLARQFAKFAAGWRHARPAAACRHRSAQRHPHPRSPGRRQPARSGGRPGRQQRKRDPRQRNGLLRWLPRRRVSVSPPMSELAQFAGCGLAFNSHL